MEIWAVTRQSKEESAAGVILRVDVRCFGVFTDETRANEIAVKNNATVAPLVLDGEDARLLQSWTNPGYFSDR